ncbi:S41 family peptidase [uncultured Polaribacter sp.]|uniref:S41 family peptidase n=1 Tax=uncultured Polaribacter sp. TaxID=174711 RepID=UPI002609EC0D|nr:S41 family peptidase [uncultured Polaribacter sp.]
MIQYIQIKRLLFLILIFSCNLGFSQSNNRIDNYKLNQDFGKIIQDLSDKYVHLEDKKTDFDCVKETYSYLLPNVTTNQEKILLFEYMLNEFYDSNLILHTKTKTSYRLNSPFYLKLKNNKFYIQNIWYSQIEDFGKNIIGAEVLNFNSKEFNKVIDKFPAQCVNKNLPEVREWIANKIVSGRYHESRILTLKLADNRKISLNIDHIKVKKEKKLLSVSNKNGIAVMRINNSFDNVNLIKQFDRELNNNLDARGLILDLRNTISKGNPHIAKALIGRLINEEMPYQKNRSKDKLKNNVEIIRSWTEYVNPRGIQYDKPVIVLVGRWTANVAEAMAVSLEGMNRAKTVGTEMRKQSGSAKNYSFINHNYGYNLTSYASFQINGSRREDFVPKFKVVQRSVLEDEVLNTAFNLLKNNKQNSFITDINVNKNIVSKLDK